MLKSFKHDNIDKFCILLSDVHTYTRVGKGNMSYMDIFQSCKDNMIIIINLILLSPLSYVDLVMPIILTRAR